VRTTVTIDPDLVAKIRALSKEQGISFKEAFNRVLRAGLGAEGKGRPYKLRPRAMRLRPGIDLDRAMRLAAALEDEETLRRLELRK
jgi:hypothetical protein